MEGDRNKPSISCAASGIFIKKVIRRTELPLERDVKEPKLEELVKQGGNGVQWRDQ